MAIFGQILLWIGFLGGSLACVSRLENKDDKWSTIPWGIYAAGAAVGIVGVVLIRIDKSQKSQASADSESDFETVRDSLQIVAQRIVELDEKLDEMTCEDVLEYIDEQCVPPCADFADGRHVLVNRFGTSVFAAVMTEFASGERYMNRAWSASADGYVDEVEKSVRYARTFFDAAVAELTKANQPQT
ncbi:MAG TPA: hypothetical protein DDW52_18095 [Planctomycetaceae bacterium]|nr:hypothetical protein [Planctomycetaceae bacterium]